MKRRFLLRVALCSSLALGFTAGSVSIAAAPNLEPFYSSHSLTISVPAGPGGGFDRFTRAISEYLPKYIPGHPHIIIQNIPAAGGVVLANQLFVTAPKDGTYIGIVRGTVMQEELYKNPQVHFHSKEFEWIANLDQEVDTCVVWAASGIKTIDDFYKKEVVVGASGVGASSYSLPIAYQKILGMKLKVITGYPGTPERLLAMERGEISGACGITMSEFRSQLSSLAKDGKLILVAQAGVKKDPRYPNLPNMLDQAKTPETRQMMEALLTPQELTFPLAAPPGTPPECVEILRRAAKQTLKDPELLAYEEHRGNDIQPTDGEATAKVVDHMFDVSPETITRLKSVIGD